MRSHLRLELPVALLMLAGTLPVAAGVLAQGNESHPAHIHEGSCTELGDVVFPLDNVGLAEAGALSGAESAIAVETSETELDVSLEDILAGPHAINIHQSDDNIQEYIACGDIGGAVRGSELLIGLASLNASGYSGVAVLEGNDAGGTTVTVYLTQGAAGEAAEAPADDAADDAAEDDTQDAAPPASTPPAETAPADTQDAAPAEGETIAVDIANFAFNPNPIEINVGDTIVWTNQDGVPHTVTGQNRDLLQSGTIQPGGTFSQTFTEAGQIDYFCEFHPNMAGSVIVN